MGSGEHSVSAHLAAKGYSFGKLSTASPSACHVLARSHQEGRARGEIASSEGTLSRRSIPCHHHQPLSVFLQEASGKTYDEIAAVLGLTNLYTAQLFLNQAQLKPETAEKLKAVVPISEEDLAIMQRPPFRSFDSSIMQEPLIYRLVEAMQHYGEGIKAVVNERKGDGILSAIDLLMDVDFVKGTPHTLI